MTKYKLAIFDLDGTILNTLDDLVDSVNYALDKYGYPKRTPKEIRKFLGNGSRNLIMLSAPKDISDDKFELLHQTFSDHYKINCSNKTAPYDKIKDVICTLRDNGIITAVISNKPDYGVQTLCKTHFQGLFDFVSGEKPDIPKKPQPDSVDAVINLFGIDKSNVVYIGDSEVDVMTARNANIDCICVTWGFRDKEVFEELKSDMIANQAEDILKYINVALTTI